jgi:hypothetical protein
MKTKVQGSSVAAAKILAKIKPGMPAAMVEQIREEANDQALKDVFGADYAQHLDAHGNPQEQGIGSTLWLLRVSDGEAARHYSAIGRFIGPAAEKAERERIARLKAGRGK